jgi:tRNA threonylcarbamoyladenosine biosynthesis protein TsaB
VTLLAIESATDMVGVALVRDDGASAERLHLGGRAHAELLVPSIEEACAASGCTIADIDVIAVDIGPGLFTGLRVGVATAKALGQALSVGLIGVTSLDILAAAALERAGTGRSDRSGGADPHRSAGTVVSVVDARRGEVFAAAYPFEGRGGPGDPIDLIDPRTVRIDRSEPMAPDALERWLSELAGAHGRVTVVGDGALRYHSQLAGHPSLDLEGAAELAAPPPLALAHLALARLARGEEAASAGDLVPDYRRPADARINWEQRAPRARPPETPTEDGGVGSR